MPDAPYTGDLDVTVVTTMDELATLLRTVHLRADRPSLRTLEARTRHDLTPLSKTAVSEMLKGTRLPRKAVMVAFLKACGEHDDRIEAWRRAWDRIADVEHGSGSPVAAPALSQPAQGAATGSGGALGAGTAEAEQLRAEVRRLNDDNKRLRLQIRSAGHAVATSEIPSSEGTGVRQAHGPELPRRELSAQLRALRVARNMTVEQVAAQLLCSSAKVRRMENGFRSGTLRDIRDLCDLYRVSDADQRDHLMDLARQSKQHGWWQGFDLPYETYIGLEADAFSIKDFKLTVVPGLLQTSDYSRTVTDALAARGLDPDAIERRVQARRIRQRLLTQEDPPLFSAVLDEAALHRVVEAPQ
jgi:transcriptional regulator with XRE-family HTH domain